MSMRSLNIAATGMLAQQLNVEVISNNIANINTTAYKRQRVEFQDLLYQNERTAGSPTSTQRTIVPSGIQIGLGVKPAAVYRITHQGNVISTSNPFDVAIQGNGFLQIELPSGGSAYTRAGALQLSPEGKTVTADGYPLASSPTVPPDVLAVTITPTGEVVAKIDGQTNLQVVGQIILSNFSNVAGLQAIGDSLFQETPSSGVPQTGNPGSIGFGTILQGFLESSNVDAVGEITTLVSAQRAYEMNSKVIQVSDEMMGMANKMKN